MNKRSRIMGILLTLTAVGQILAAWLLYDSTAPSVRINTGWGILFLSALFGWLPIFTFRARGKIEGKSYVNTTMLVDSGIYSIVRHPQYVAGILINIALSLITTHWLVILLGIICLAIYYSDSYAEEEKNLVKFGDDYLDYQRRVPRFNFLLGIFRVLSGRFNK